MDRLVEFYPGFNCGMFKCKFNDPECVKSPNYHGVHGVHGLTIAFVVKAPLGAVVLDLHFTNTFPGAGRFEEGSVIRGLFTHSHKPHYEGQEPQPNCEYLGGAPCFPECSSLGADEPKEILFRLGDEALFKWLEQYYRCRFEDGDWPETPEYLEVKG